MTISGLICKFIEKKGKMAQVEVEGQSLQIPCEFLPNKAVPGQELKIKLLTEEEAKVQEKRMAQAILDEILNGK